MDLATDPYVPLIGTLPPNADREQAGGWIARQQQRLVQGAGFSFAIADARSDEALGSIGLGLAHREQGRASVGYSVAPRARGHRVAADALSAVVSFAWSIPELFRLEAHIEPWNIASIRTAEAAGFQHEGLLRSYQLIGSVRRDLSLYAVVRPA